MAELTQRQETMLALIIHEYTETGQPVGSVNLVDKYNLGVSSATVRNEMVALTDSGLLRQPHTSAGRVPSKEEIRSWVTTALAKAA